MNYPRFITFAGLLLTSLFTSISYADELLDRSIAIVNKTVITESELMSESRDVTRQLSAKGINLPPLDELYKQVL